MAIPASNIVSIVPRLLTAGAQDLEINGLIFTQNAILPASTMAMQFASAQAVGNFFGLASDEYNLATVYFLGYRNSFAKPRNLVFARRVEDAIPATLYGAALTANLAALQAVTDGSMDITIDGTDVNLTALDFSAATSFSAVAALIQSTIATAGSTITAAYSSQSKGFTLTTTTTGAAATITVASDGTAGTPVAALLGLSLASGAIASQGSDTLTVTENMSQIRAITDNWVTFTTMWEPTPDEMVEYAQWAGSMGVEYLYLPWSVDATLLQQVETTSPAYVLQQANVGSTALQYGSAKESVSTMGTAASIDWNRLDSVITFAFKRQDGLVASVEDENDSRTLMNKRVNFRGNYATRNDNFVFQYQGAMFGDYRFIDPYINAVWFNNALQASIMNGLVMAGRVPYNEAGYTKIEAWMMDPIIRAKRNGIIDVGMVLSESQKAELFSEAGRDISEELWTNGYVVQIEDPGASVRVTRDSPNISLWYTYAGSVHRIVVASTAIV